MLQHLSNVTGTYLFYMVANTVKFAAMEWIITPDNIKKIATAFWNLSEETTVFAFYGSMGAGKTTFINALCDVKKVKDTVSSPTYSIINEYLFTENGILKKIYHIDLYRLKDEWEAQQAGVEDCLYSNHICLVEWPEKALFLFPPDTMHVYINALNPETRRIRIADK